MSWFRFGVASRLSLSFACAAMFTLLASAIGIHSFQLVRDGFDNIVASRLPAVASAYRIGQHAEAIAANAPQLAATNSAWQRESLAARLTRHVTWLEREAGRMSEAGVAPELLNAVNDIKQRMADRQRRLMDLLDRREALAVRSRDLRSTIEAARRDAVALQTRLEQDIETGWDSALDRLGTNADPAIAQARDAWQDQRALAAWGEAMEGAASAAEAALSLQTAAALDEERRRADSLLAAAREPTQTLDPRHRAATNAITEALGTVIDAPDGAFAVRLQRFELAAAVDALLADNRRMAEHFIQSVERLIAAAEGMIENESKAFSESFAVRTRLLAVVALAGLAAVIVLSVYLGRSIVWRLTELQRSMKLHAGGRSAPIPLAGDDEIADMARSLQYFVGAIRRREDAYRESERRFRDIAEVSSDWFWETGPDHCFTYLSDRIHEVCGVRPADVVGEPRHAVAAEDTMTEKWARLGEDLEARRPFRGFQYRLRVPGGIRHIRISGTPVFDEAGTFQGYRGSGTDITAEVEARARLDAALENMPGAFVLWDSDDRMVLCNRQHTETYASIAGLVRPGARFLDVVRASATSGDILNAAGRVEDYVRDRVAYHRDPRGAFLQYMTDGRCLQINESRTEDGMTVAVITDITERTRVEQELLAAKERYQDLAEGSIQGIVIHRDLKPVFVNDSAARIFRVSADGRNALDSIEQFIAPHEKERLGRYMALRMSGQAAPEVYEFEGRRGDGSPVWVLAAARTIDWEGERAIQTSLLDISERKRFEEELRQAKDAAERANLAKSRFLAVASHDLRQPLHAMGLFISALSERCAGCARGESLRTITNIQDSQTAVESLLESLLDISRLEAGIVSPEVRPLSLSRMLTRLGDQFSVQAADKGLSLRIVECNLWVESDPVLLRRMLDNLVSNAVRYTERGGVLVGCRRRGQTVRLEVWDTGIGVPPDSIQEIFQEFRQLGNPGRDRRRGLGLGLAIVDGLGRLLGHRVSARSQPGRGSVFAVELPLTTPAAVPARPADLPVEAAMSGTTRPLILAIDDDEEVRLAMAELVVGWGFEVSMHATSSDALAAVTAAHAPPALILADYRLGDEDGIQAIERLREALQQPVPAAIITGDTAPEVLRRAKSCGYRLLHKPLQPAKLRQLIRSAVMRGAR